MQVFIVRPFGTKKVLKKGATEPDNFNFDLVETDLIRPAMNEAGLSGGTTGQIFEAGDIREDMFSGLLIADIVIADITIHNANVFYELGVRHALRDKATILVKCSGYDDTPFDILGYRYVSYSKDEPAKALPDLLRAINETQYAQRKDSPVFNMLPKLRSQDPEFFLAVPNDFGEEVALARDTRQQGKLALLAEEVMDFSWKIPALRVIGDAQYVLKDFEDAQLTWEKVRNQNQEDAEANERLATIYQRLSYDKMSGTTRDEVLLGQSELAVKRLLKKYSELSTSKRSESFALQARNLKQRWIMSWKKGPQEQWAEKALSSPYLLRCLKSYLHAYEEDLNSYYAGINALAMIVIVTSLADRFKLIWELNFDSEDEAEAELKKLKRQQQNMAAMILTSITTEKKRHSQLHTFDPWLSITEADYNCLTGRSPQRVAGLYSSVIQQSTDLSFESARNQLLIYQQLGVLTSQVNAALAVFEEQAISMDAEAKTHYILFTGHMIDRERRTEPRFPKEMENTVRAAIKTRLQQEVERLTGLPIIGIAGGACGSDIIFHELCEELGIKSRLYLLLPRDQYIAESVHFAGNHWVHRFDTLMGKLPVYTLLQHKALPKWLQKKPHYSIWERNNLWMLYSALVCGGPQLTIIAVWDGKKGDGPGGTEHLVQTAKQRGGKVEIIRIDEMINQVSDS